MLYYEHGGITIYHGDCRDVLPSICADVLVTDPPYGFAAYEYDKRMPSELLTLMVEKHKTVAVFGYPEVLVSWCVDAAVYPNEWVTWWPTNKTEGRSNGLSRSTEHIAIFGPTPGAKQIKRPRSLDAWGKKLSESRGLSGYEAREHDVWRDPAPGVQCNSHLRLHPNEKPLSLITKLVLMCSTAEQVILDPFMGSGTTLRAAKDLGRKAIGIEIEERYCEIASLRLQQEVFDFGATK